MADETEVVSTPDATPTPATPAPSSPGERLVNQLKADHPNTAAPTPEAEPVATPEPAEPTFVQQLEAMGFQGVTDEKEAQKRVLEALKQERTKAEAAAREAAEIRRLRELEAQQAANPSQPTTATAPTPEQPARPWHLPKLDDELLERYQTVTTDPTSGKQVVAWAEGTPAEVRAKYAEYERASKEWANTIVHNPHEFIAALKEELFAEMPQVFEQRMAEKTAQQQQQQFIENFKTENATWLYTTDPVTKQPIDYSAEGKQFNQLLNEAADLGITDPQKAIAYAMRLRNAEKAQALANRASVADINEQKKRDLQLRGAGNPPSQGGSQPTLTDGNRQRTQNPKLPAGERFLQTAAANGLVLPT